MSNEYPLDRDAGNRWDGIFRGRSSSVRRGLLNCAGATATMASVLSEAARHVDALPEPDREVEIHGLCDEITEMTETVLAIRDELRAHAGLPAPPPKPAGRFMRAWRWIRRDFTRWIHG